MLNSSADTNRLFRANVPTYNPSHAFWTGKEWLVFSLPSRVISTYPYPADSSIEILHQICIFFLQGRFMAPSTRTGILISLQTFMMPEKICIDAIQTQFALEIKKSNFNGNNNDKQQFATTSKASFAIRSFPEILNLILKLHN